jgi:hypothetical protein
MLFYARMVEAVGALVSGTAPSPAWKAKSFFGRTLMAQGRRQEAFSKPLRAAWLLWSHIRRGFHALKLLGAFPKRADRWRWEAHWKRCLESPLLFFS